MCQVWGLQRINIRKITMDTILVRWAPSWLERQGNQLNCTKQNPQPNKIRKKLAGSKRLKHCRHNYFNSPHVFTTKIFRRVVEPKYPLTEVNVCPLHLEAPSALYGSGAISFIASSAFACSSSFLPLPRWITTSNTHDYNVVPSCSYCYLQYTWLQRAR